MILTTRFRRLLSVLPPSMLLLWQVVGLTHGAGTPISHARNLPPAASAAAVARSEHARIQEVYGKLPLSFEANQGQHDSGLSFVSRGPGFGLYLTPRELFVSLARPASPRTAREIGEDKRNDPGEAGEPDTAPGDLLRLSFAKANPEPKLVGMEELPGKANYFIGNDPARWRTGVSTYAKVRYQDIYPGVDLVYYGNQQQLEYDFIVAPGSDPRRIRLAFNGAASVEIDAGGELVLHTSGGDLLQHKPVVYQEIDGERRPIRARYVLKARHQVAFEVARYDRSKPLVIDPVLVYSTLLGGTGQDTAKGIAVDPEGSAYVTGFTSSADFPLVNPLQGSLKGDTNAFVTKLSPDGRSIVYSTYIGGTRAEYAEAICVDTFGNAYLTGVTYSTDFPTASPLQSSSNLQGNAFVVKLKADGSALTYSTYLGGTGFQQGNGIAVDSAGNAYVVGYTDSREFPTVNSLQPAKNSHVVLKSRNSGSEWDVSDDGLNSSHIYDLQFDPVNLSTVYAATNTGVFKSMNGGGTWNRAGLARQYTTRLAINPLHPSTIYALTASGLFKTTDGGDNWGQLSLPPLLSYSSRGLTLDPQKPDTVYLATNGTSQILKSTDGGATWRTFQIFPNSYGSSGEVSQFAVDPRNSSIIYAATRYGTYKSSDEGTTWTQLPDVAVSGSPHYVYSVAVDQVDSSTLYIGSALGIAKSTDRGMTWSAQRTGGGIEVDALVIDPKDSMTVFAAAGSGGLLKTIDGGATWSQLSIGTNSSYVGAVAIDPKNTSNVLAGTNTGADVFVAKLKSDGSALEFSTYIGGSEDDEGTGIALDGDDNAYITGFTYSLNFPTAGPIQAKKGDLFSCDAFLAKLNSSGNALIYSTYLGGESIDKGFGVAVDTAGSAYVTGQTYSTGFPTANAMQNAKACAGCDAFQSDAFVAKVNAAGSALLYSTYFGGSGNDTGFGIAVDSKGNAYIAGSTSSSDFPTAGGSPTGNKGLGTDAFVAELYPSGTSLRYSTYLGGSGTDSAARISVDSTGSAYVTGTTGSSDFPLVNSLRSPAAFNRAFVTKLATGADLAVTMKASSDNVSLGDNLTYNVQVTAQGELPSTGVAVTDVLPTGASFVSAVPSQGSCGGGGTVTCNLGDLAVGASASIAITIKPPAVKSISNTVQVNGHEPEATLANNTATVVTSITYADLSVTNTAVVDRVKPGGLVNFFIAITNNDGVTASDVVLTHSLSSGATLVSCNSTAGPCSGSGNQILNIPSLAAGSSVTAVVTVKVGDTVSEGSAITSTASVAAGIPDPNNSNNSAAANVTVSASPVKCKSNGRIAYYVDLSSLNGAKPAGLYTINPDGTGEALAINNDRTFYLPKWSPDGTKLALLNNSSEIFVINSDGTGRVRVATDARSGATWAPNSSMLVYLATDGFIHMVTASGTGLGKVPNLPSIPIGTDWSAPIDWSPDGSAFAYSNGTDILLVNVDGTNTRNLTQSRLTYGGEPVSGGRPRWSPDGSRILFMGRSTNSNETYIVNTDGSGLSRAFNTLGYMTPAWSPDGTGIAYVYQNALFVDRIDGAQSTKITDLNFYTYDTQPDWQPLIASNCSPAPTPGQTFSISGRTTGPGGGAIGAFVSLSGTRSGNLYTAPDGSYMFVNLPAGGSYTITASNKLYNFAPANRTLANLSRNETGVDFATTDAINYSISGRLADSAGVALPGQEVTLGKNGFLESRQLTDKDGRYSFQNLAVGMQYVVYPTYPSAYSYQPEAYGFNSLSASQTADFVGTKRPPQVQFSTASYVIGEGAGIASITVTRTGDLSASSTVEYATSDGTASQMNKYIASLGTLTFAPNESSKTFNVMIVDEGYQEGNQTVNLSLTSPQGATLGSQATAVLTIIDNDVAPAVGNPLDDGRFFAQQQYLDFLNRQPETGGWSDWSNYVSACAAGDYQCQVDHRVATSAGFFRSPEFFQTGYFVMRMYRATLYPRPAGDVPPHPSYQEFLHDAPSVHYGVAGDTLAASKLAFAQAWVQRADFLATYPAAMSTGDFIDKLAQSAGVMLSTSDKQALLGLTRAQIVIQVVDNPQVDAREYNAAFVTMQYMGYLRRMPEKGGYLAWLQYLDANPDNCAIMINGFAFSKEYRERFGPYGDQARFPTAGVTSTACAH